MHIGTNPLVHHVTEYAHHPSKILTLPPRQPLFDFSYHLLIELDLKLHINEIIC